MAPQGEEVLLRIADPAVTRALLVHAHSIKDPTLFGPCTHVSPLMRRGDAGT
jgi:hypothetical protein